MLQIYQKYKAYWPAAFFIGGFIFDIVTTDRIDHGLSLFQQAFYLFLLFIFLYWEVISPTWFQKEGSFLQKLWRFHVEILHFLFGSLLSLYTIFYFKSASALISLLFLVVMVGLLVLNEMPRFHRYGILIRSCLFALCLSSYFIYLVPVMTGNIGIGSFVLSMVISISLFLILGMRVFRKTQAKDLVLKKIVYPGLVVQLLFMLFYWLKILPPVPISLKTAGIYHHIEKQEGHYYLNYERDWWRFWQSGAQTFVKRDGDALFCFVSIFSPADFSDDMSVRFYKKGKKGWAPQDRIPLKIRGGRAQGFRGFVRKSNFGLGTWQVRVLTSDDREVGRLGFRVVDPEPDSQRKWRQDVY